MKFLAYPIQCLALLPSCRIHKPELAQEEKELNRYENLCASRMEEGVYAEECDYGEIKGQQGQASCDRCEDDTHQQQHLSTTNEYKKSTQITEQSNEPEYVNIIKHFPNTKQTQDTSRQLSMLPHNELAVHVEKYHKAQESPSTEHQMPREFEGTSGDVDEEVYDDTQPHQQPRGKGQHDPYHLEKKAAMGSMAKKFDDQKFNDHDYIATPSQSSAAGHSARYQPLLSRDGNYENINLGGYNSINASQQQDESTTSGFDVSEDYEYVVTKPRYCYRPSVK
jgi:hypothetical protein